MRKQTIDETRRCPKCGKVENQVNADTIGQEHSDVYAKTANTNIRLMERHEHIRKRYATTL